LWGKHTAAANKKVARAKCAAFDADALDQVKFHKVTIELPDIEGLEQIGAPALRVELACALFERGQIGKTGGAALAGLDFFSFQSALTERGISAYSQEDWQQDLATIKALESK